MQTTLGADFISAINSWSLELGFSEIGIAHTDLSAWESRLERWLRQDYHGDMDYMYKHGLKRSRPAALIPGTCSIICARMPYLCEDAATLKSILNQRQLAYISRYALGRDYHKVVRQQLQKLVDKIAASVGPFRYRVFADSAPVMEKPLGVLAGLGWMGKHTNLIHEKQGSYFFLGEVYTDLALPAATPRQDHCGDCERCITACPTGAIVAPYQLDARRCISYLTIEFKGIIPVELRPLIGNRIYGCDDCQIYCPWNRFQTTPSRDDFMVRHQLNHIKLIELFNWGEAKFTHNIRGMALKRIDYRQWMRNIAVALGNADFDAQIVQILTEKKPMMHDLVKVHIDWALAEQERKRVLISTKLSNI